METIDVSVGVMLLLLGIAFFAGMLVMWFIRWEWKHPKLSPGQMVTFKEGENFVPLVITQIDHRLNEPMTVTLSNPPLRVGRHKNER